MIHWDHPSQKPKWRLGPFSHFCTAQRSVPILLQQAAPFPLKITPSHGGIWTPSNTWFLGPTGVLNPNKITTLKLVVVHKTQVFVRAVEHLLVCVDKDEATTRATWPFVHLQQSAEQSH